MIPGLLENFLLNKILDHVHFPKRPGLDISSLDPSVHSEQANNIVVH